MNKKTLLVVCLVFVVLMIAAAGLYNALADDVQLGGLATTPPQTQPATESVPDDPTVAADTQPTEPPANMAPDFTMLDMDGNEVTLSSFFGKPIILNFWASWCGPCKMEMPELQNFYEKYGEDIHFLLVSVDDSLDSVKDFMAGTDYTFPVYFDATSAGAYTYGASSIPLTFFIDAEGNLTAYYMSAMSEDILQQGVDLILPEAE